MPSILLPSVPTPFPVPVHQKLRATIIIRNIPSLRGHGLCHTAIKRLQEKEIQPLPLQITTASFVLALYAELHVMLVTDCQAGPASRAAGWTLGSKAGPRLALSHQSCIQPLSALSPSRAYSSVPTSLTATHCPQKVLGPKYKCKLEYF